MEHIIEHQDEGISIVKLASGKSNALHPAMVGELLAAVRRASADPEVKGLVLASDRPRFFSPGFDVTRVFQFDRAAMGEFFGCFIDLYEALLAVPKPVVAAVSGHAVAGGAVLALTADERVLCEGDYRFALLEVDLGVELPQKVMRMMMAAGGFPAAGTSCWPVHPSRLRAPSLSGWPTKSCPQLRSLTAPSAAVVPWPVSRGQPLPRSSVTFSRKQESGRRSPIAQL